MMTMTTTPHATPVGPTSAPPAATRDSSTSGDARLDHLDDALVEVRRVLQRPAYRARIVAELGRVELAALRLLRAVQRAEEPPSIGDIADVLVVDPSTASRVVDRAIDAGHLGKQACATDRRRARLHLTGSGRALLDEATRRRRAVLGEVTADWEDADVDALIELLARLLTGFDRVLGDA